MIWFTISKASRIPETTNYQSRVFGYVFDSYWLAVAVCILLTYCNRVGFTVTRWENGVSVEETRVTLFTPQQTLSSISAETFQQAAVLVGQLYRRS